MRSTARRLGVVVAAVATGCGGSPGSLGATASLSGGLSGSASVTVTAGVNSHLVETTPVWALNMSPASADASPTLVFNIFVAGTSPQTGTFTTSNSLAAQGELEGSQWMQSFESTDGTQEAGSFELNITATGSPSPPDGTGWPYFWHNLHGTLTAVFVPSPTTNGHAEDVAVDVTF